MAPLVSVIIPVYNVEKYLRECVDSVIAQTYTHIEIILVDDGSTDGSSAICDAYAQMDARIKVIHKANGGQASARNVAMDTMQGEYVMFLDSDDYWGSNTLMQDLLNTLSKNPSIRILQFSVCRFNDGEGIAPQPANNAKLISHTTTEILSNIGSTTYGSIVCNKIFNTALIKSLRFPVGKWYEDEYFSLETLLLVDKIWIDLSIGSYCYRQRNDSIMGATGAGCMKAYTNRVLLHKHQLNFYKEHNIKAADYWSTIVYSAIHNLLLGINHGWNDKDTIIQFATVFREFIPSMSIVKSSLNLTDLTLIFILKYFGAKSFVNLAFKKYRLTH